MVSFQGVPKQGESKRVEQKEREENRKSVREGGRQRRRMDGERGLEGPCYCCQSGGGGHRERGRGRAKENPNPNKRRGGTNPIEREETCQK